MTRGTSSHGGSQQPDICKVTARSTSVVGDGGVNGAQEQFLSANGTGDAKDQASYEQLLEATANARNTLQSRSCNPEDFHLLLHHQQRPFMGQHHQPEIIGNINGDSLPRPNRFGNSCQFHGKCFLLDGQCVGGGTRVNHDQDCDTKCGASVTAKLNGTQSDYNELMNKCVNLQMRGVPCCGGVGAHEQMVSHVLDCRQVGPAAGLCFDNCNYGYGPEIGNLLLLESEKIGATEAALLTKQRQAGTATTNGRTSNGAVTPTASMNSGMMPWRHRQCSSSRGSSSSGSSSTRWDFPTKHWLAMTSILLIAGAAGVAVPLALRVTAGAPFEERLEAAIRLLDAVPLIDGHNDLPWNIRKFLHNQLNDFPFDTDLRQVNPWAKSNWSHTDLSRLRKGQVSAQFWAAYVPCEAQHRDAVQLTLEQIDVIRRLTERYSPQLTTCSSVNDIREAHKNKQLCSLTGVEGGHSLGGSLGVLRTFYSVGVRYMTLTSTCHTPWADSSYADAPKFDVKHGGLTAFGKTIIKEMNRLGMIVDLSHTSVGTMRDALEVSEAPVIFSHSSAYELCNSSRNVQNDILEAITKNRGLVMVNFYSLFLSCSQNSTVNDAVAHINHIRKVAGIDHVGIGAGFDGINYTPKGLEDVSTYPTLFAELLGDGWTVEELTKLAGQNFLRVLGEVEEMRDKKKQMGVKPFEDIPNFRTEDSYNCTSS